MKTTNRALLIIAIGFGLAAAFINSENDMRRDELGAVIYLPKNYVEGTPTPVLYWLHWYRGNAYACPPMKENPNFIIVAPKFNRDAMWEDYDLNALVLRVEKKYPASIRYIEGYSRGANGAIYHAAKNPGMFAGVFALAGSYPDHLKVSDPLMILGGKLDDRWGEQSQVYADAVGESVVWINSTHNPLDFYGQLADRVDHPTL